MEIFEFTAFVVELVVVVLFVPLLLNGFETMNRVVLLLVGVGFTIIGEEWMIAWGGKIGAWGNIGTILPFAKISVPGPNVFKAGFDFVILLAVADDFMADVTNGAENIDGLVMTAIL